MDTITLLNRAKLEEALCAFLDHVSPTCSQAEYRLVGTGAALLHGVQLPAADIDILARDRSSVDAFGAALSPFGCRKAPGWLPEGRQYYGCYEVKEVELQISTVEVASEADTIETFGRGPWGHFTFLACGHHAVPTVALELRLLTELRRNRPDRYRQLNTYLQSHGCDTSFITRGMEAAGLAQAVQDDVLNGLDGAPFSAVVGSGREKGQQCDSANLRLSSGG